MSGGVYAIVNTVNGHVYIGATISFAQRWQAHRKALSEGTHHNKHLQSAWLKYGSAAFTFKKLAIITPEAERYRAEADWIKLARRLLGPHCVYNCLEIRRPAPARTRTPSSSRQPIRARVVTRKRPRQSRRAVTSTYTLA